METVNAHRLVANLCNEMAENIYDHLATHYPMWYAANPDKDAFVVQCAPTLREHARQTLAEMLGRPDLEEEQKRDIYQALLLDNSLPRTGPFEFNPHSQTIH